MSEYLLPSLLLAFIIILTFVAYILTIPSLSTKDKIGILTIIGTLVGASIYVIGPEVINLLKEPSITCEEKWELTGAASFAIEATKAENYLYVIGAYIFCTSQITLTNSGDTPAKNLLVELRNFSENDKLEVEPVITKWEIQTKKLNEAGEEFMPPRIETFVSIESIIKGTPIKIITKRICPPTSNLTDVGTILSEDKTITCKKENIDSQAKILQTKATCLTQSYEKQGLVVNPPIGFTPLTRLKELKAKGIEPPKAFQPLPKECTPQL